MVLWQHDNKVEESKVIAVLQNGSSVGGEWWYNRKAMKHIC